jgi:oleate hydratase
VFTTEYSVRTAMEAVYTFLDVERAVPEVFGSTYDIRELLKAAYYLRDRKSLTEAPLPTKLPIPGLVKSKALKKIKGTWVEELLKESHLL